MVRQFGAATEADTVALVVRTACLRQGAVPDAVSLIPLAERAHRQQPRNRAYQAALAVALYRAGRFEDAAKQLVKACGVDGKSGKAADHLLLAMAWQRLGRHAEARQALEGECRRLDQPPSVPRPAWTEHLEQPHRRREAESLIVPALTRP
jgi:hypothetical protein